MESLLICIAYHHIEHRFDYLKKVIHTYLTYTCPRHIIIDTNSHDTKILLDREFKDNSYRRPKGAFKEKERPERTI